MQNFEYVAATSVEQVVSILSRNGAQASILAGGTDLLVQLREGRKTAQVVVDIKRVPQVNELTYDAQAGLTIGAAVSCARLCADALVSGQYPGLVDGFSLIGGTQIQNRASVGGNLCNASPAADAAPALMVHQALLVLLGPEGQRQLPVENFFGGPGKNVLKAGEFLVAIRVPPPPPGFGAHYLRFIPRNEMDIAVVGAGAGVVLSEDGRRFQSVRISLGAVAPVPLLAAEAGQALAGREVAPEAIRQAALLAQQAAQPIDDMRGTVAQRRHLAGILARRAIEGAVERARAGLTVMA